MHENPEAQSHMSFQGATALDPVVNRKQSIPAEFDVDENCDDEHAMMLEGRQEDNPAAQKINESDLEQSGLTDAEAVEIIMNELKTLL